jgi:hypothetical protein
MLLGVVKGELVFGEVVVDLAGDVALETAECFFLGESLFHASFDVVPRAGVVGRAGDHDSPERALAWRSPPRLSRCRSCLPLLASSGDAPQR